MINVTIWNEYIHEQRDEIVKKIYPNGMHNCIKELGNEAINILLENSKKKSNNRNFLAKPKIIERGSVHKIK